MVVLVNYIGKILVNYIGKILVNYIGGIIRNKDNMHHSCFTKCMEMESFIIYGNGNIWKLQNCKNGWTTKHCNMVLIWFIKFIPSRKLSHNYGKSPCYSWGNSLFLWPCSIANCWHNKRVLLVIWLKRRFLIPIRHGLCKSKGMEELCHVHINISKWGGHVYRCLQYHS
jgi:hypothetical protein